MPIVILLDTSLSMNQVVNADTATPITRLNLAQYGLNSLLNFLSTNNKMELVALCFFSNTCEVVSKFTRDYAFLKSRIHAVQTKDTTNLIQAFVQVREFINEEWGSDLTYDVVVITDGNAVMESSYMQRSSSMKDVEIKDLDASNWPLPLSFKSKIHIICIDTLQNVSLQKSLYFYKRIISKNCQDAECTEVNVPCEGGQIWIPDHSTLNFELIEQLFLKLANDYFKSFVGKVVCGNLSCPVTLFPNLVIENGGKIDSNIDQINIQGFLDIVEISSPRVLSRHLVLPIPEGIEEFKKWTMFINLKSDITEEDLLNMFGEEGKQPSFSVLLHGSFKVANMVALVQLGSSNHFGMLYSRTDSKKKSNLMLSTFEPGFSPIPWMSNLKNLAISEVEIVPAAKSNKKVNNYVTWLQPNAIHNDIQKIMRGVRKLPDKYETVLTELNRIQRSAIAFHFFEIIDVIIQMLEKEKSTAQKETAEQLGQIIKYLKQTTEA